MESKIKNLEDFITIQDAAETFNKTESNISYLIQYKRINKYYIRRNEIVSAKSLSKNDNKVNGSPLVSKKELENYFKAIRIKEQDIIDKIPNCNKDLLFFDVPERERTKHVHRLHPYMGKFIPQLVEYYLDRDFEKKDLILDPFMGSGTTLVEANVKQINSIGIDISKFNCMIADAKITKYDIKLLEDEVDDIFQKTQKIYKNSLNGTKSHKVESLDKFLNIEDSEISLKRYETDNEYLNKWFATPTLKQMLIYKSLIPEYKYQNFLKVLLSRCIRSARLTFHFELTRLKEPIYEPYVCHKHKNKVCVPTQSLLGFLKRYSKDSVKRVKEFSKIRTEQQYSIISSDSAEVDLSPYLRDFFNGKKIDGVITSPPYVGLINYHTQHIYAYELYDIEKQEENEIGRKDLGTSIKAKDDYKFAIANVFKNIKKFLKDNANLFIVANDKWDLYPKIAELSGYKIINREERPVTKKASRERSFYSESIFNFTPN